MSNALFDTLFKDLSTSSARFIDLPGGQLLTYSQVFNLTGRIANALVALGVKPGDRIAVQVDKSYQAIALYLAAVRCGAVFLPLNNAYTPTEVEYFLQDATPSVFVCTAKTESALSDMASTAGARSVTLNADGSGSLMAAAETCDSDFNTIARDENDLAAILYTSGTTGRSKGAMLTHRNLASNALTLALYWGVSSDDVLLHALPIFHTHGLFVATNTVMVVGASMIFLPRFDVDIVIEALPHSSVMMGVPTFYTRLLQQAAFTKALVKHMRLFVSGSAPMLMETHIKFRERTGHTVLERYGMTETNMNTSNPYSGERKIGTVGLPLPRVEVRIADPETGVVLPAGEVGVLELRGPNVFKGYWQMPEKTKAEFRDDGFFISGDLASIDADGYVSIVGRGKDLIISGGFNVYPKEIETEIDLVPGVVESAVIGVPHPDFGEAVVAVIVTSGDTKMNDSAILNHLKDRLARFKQPKQIHFVSELPRNTMGKVQKNVLRDQYGGEFSAV